MLEKDKNIAGVVVLYNPDDVVFSRNIPSYLAFIDRLYLVDNSENDLSVVQDFITLDHPKVVYIKNNSNLGIAKALNLGADEAIKDGFGWTLTMDQDSWFDKEDIQKLLASPGKLADPNVAIITPVHIDTEADKVYSSDFFTKTMTAMTSGNLLNLSFFEEIGKFKEDYFIDMVDHEYCFRANSKNFIVLQLNNVFLNHNLGDIKKYRIPFYKTVGATNHSALRRYYWTRNYLYFRKQYIKQFPKEVLFIQKEILMNMIKCALFEKSKLAKLKMIIKGIKDYRHHVTGKLQVK